MTSDKKVIRVGNKPKFIGNQIPYQYLSVHNVNFVKEAEG